ncbi:DUF4244 domain-containing protein [Gulosibacter hominis]|uniref:DUF4244 domain-containing protein n=1 Tax=Gulosibacter hominis TaxID=2770504 RepID=UPI001918ECED|nr:DUF4244 domain-containing protein [Gulosibacter hominis]
MNTRINVETNNVETTNVETTNGSTTVPTAARLLGRLQRLRHEEDGAATAEYAIVITAAVALASVLVLVAQSESVKQIIEDLLIGAFGG